MSTAILMSEADKELLNRQIQDLEEQLAKAKIALHNAAAQGDLSENAEHEEAKNEITGINAQLQDLYAQRENARLYTESDVQTSTIDLGVSFSIKIDSTEYKGLRMISDGLAVTPYKTISKNSKLGSLLVGKRRGDSFDYADNIFREHTVEILEVG